MFDVVVALGFFWLVGWIVHKIMGRDGNFLHFIFIGGSGAGLGVLLEWIMGRRIDSFWGVLGLWIVCSLIVECVIRWIKRKLELKMIHALGAKTFEDIGGDPDEWTIYE